mgnify:CR=1 FL=1
MSVFVVCPFIKNYEINERNWLASLMIVQLKKYMDNFKALA